MAQRVMAMRRMYPLAGKEMVGPLSRPRWPTHQPPGTGGRAMMRRRPLALGRVPLVRSFQPHGWHVPCVRCQCL